MSLSFLQANASTSDLTTYTFAGENLGTAASDRYIVVCVESRRASGTPSISSMTVGGVSASQVATTATSAAGNIVAMWMAAVPTGTTGDVVITFDTTMLRCVIQLYRLVDLVSSTASDTDASTANPPAVTLTVPANGVVIGCGASYGASSANATWTGLNENADQYVDSNVNASSASDSIPAGASLATQVSFGSGSSRGAVWASWELAGGGGGGYIDNTTPILRHILGAA